MKSYDKILSESNELHWKKMSQEDRESLLKQSHLPLSFANDDWRILDHRAKAIMGKHVHSTQHASLKENELVERSSSYENNSIVKKALEQFDDPLAFLLNLIPSISKLPIMGKPNARELVKVWNDNKKNKITAKLVESVLAEGIHLEKGWVNVKNNKIIHQIRMMPYHVQMIVKTPKNFGITEKQIKSILKARLDDAGMWENDEDTDVAFEQLRDGSNDHDTSIELLAMKKGWHRFVFDSGYFSVVGSGTIKDLHRVSVALGVELGLFDESEKFHNAELSLRMANGKFHTKQKKAWDIKQKPKFLRWIKHGGDPNRLPKKDPKRQDVALARSLGRYPPGHDEFGSLKGRNVSKKYAAMYAGKDHEMKTYQQFIVEILKTKEIKSSEFPDPLSARLKAIFQMKGEMDGQEKDDIVQTKPNSWAAANLKPSQSAIFLGKALGMAIGGVRGGDLGSIVSKDKYILDGHHRWAATLFSEPSAKIQGIEANLGIGDLVPVLRALGDSLGNQRRGEPAGGDVNIFKATFQDVLDAIHDGKNMHPKFYDKDKAVAWLKNIGEDELKKRFAFIQKRTPPKGAPRRIEMPVIDADKGDEKLASKLLSKGKLDVREPYAKQS